MSCGPLGDPSNGEVDTSAGTYFEDVAVYSCDSGYKLNGSAKRTCQANGQWDGSEPTCESKISEFTVTTYQQCVCVHVMLVEVACRHGPYTCVLPCKCSVDGLETPCYI